jgi:hypothetical protein
VTSAFVTCKEKNQRGRKITVERERSKIFNSADLLSLAVVSLAIGVSRKRKDWSTT